MCGVIGFIDFSKFLNKSNLETFIETLKHIGPDDSGTFFLEDKNFFLGIGHKRLTILDPTEKGKQPMINNDVIISYNGEIYNFLEIKKDLIELGFEFKTSTDTEVVLNAYIMWGLEFFKKLNGMFAISIFDKKKNKIFLIRDRLGVKPLYWSFDNDQFFFQVN